METNTLQKTSLEYLKDEKSITAVIATTSHDGTAHTALIYYSIDDTFNFYFLTLNDSEKFKNLLVNPKISITVGFGPAYVTMQGSGVATLLEKGSVDENRAILNIRERITSAKRYWPVLQLPEASIEKIAVFKIIPETLRLLNLEEANSSLVFDKGFQKVI